MKTEDEGGVGAKHIGYHRARDFVQSGFVALITEPRTNLFDFQPKPPRGTRSCCKIADELEDDLVDDRVPNCRKTAGRSPVLARKTTMTWQTRCDQFRR